MKTCSKCKKEKNREEFSVRTDSKDGLRGYCQECEREAKRNYAEKNREKIRIRTAQWRIDNLEELRAKDKGRYPREREARLKRQKEYSKNNREAVLLNNRRWRQANHNKVNELSRRWTEENREKRKEISLKSYYKNKERILLYAASARKDNAKQQAARGAINNAIRAGRLTRGRCLICGEERTDAHHDNYDKPFDIVWLCRKHHKRLHAGLFILYMPPLSTDIIRVAI